MEKRDSESGILGVVADIIKVDKNNNPLAGAALQIIDAEGNVTKDSTSERLI